MIITKEVEIKLRGRNIKHFKNKGYDISKNEIIVKVEDLMKKSHVKILVKCGKCGDENNIEFHSYNSPYLCKKCAPNIKMKKSKLEKYGYESYVNPEKCKKTKMERYNTLDMSDRIKDAVQYKYGVDNVFQLEEVKEKIKNTIMEKYGVYHISQNEEIKNKKEKTFNDKYGGTLFGSDIMKEKINKTIMEKYGVEYISQNEEIKLKKIKTSIENYGLPYYVMTDQYKINNGILLDKDIINKWVLYKRGSRRLFEKIRHHIFEDWNGYDYYDNEYIKDYLNLNYNDKRYPTIDHKISVFQGFIDNITIEEINKSENLVVTKRSINSTKGKKSE